MYTLLLLLVSATGSSAPPTDDPRFEIKTIMATAKLHFAERHTAIVWQAETELVLESISEAAIHELDLGIKGQWKFAAVTLEDGRSVPYQITPASRPTGLSKILLKLPSALEPYSRVSLLFKHSGLLTGPHIPNESHMIVPDHTNPKWPLQEIFSISGFTDIFPIPIKFEDGKTKWDYAQKSVEHFVDIQAPVAVNPLVTNRETSDGRLWRDPAPDIYVNDEDTSLHTISYSRSGLKNRIQLVLSCNIRACRSEEFAQRQLKRLADQKEKQPDG